MSLIEEIKDQILSSPSGEVFISFDDMFEEFPGDRPDMARPFDPVDLGRMQMETKNAGLHPFSKKPNEGGVWFRMQ